MARRLVKYVVSKLGRFVRRRPVVGADNAGRVHMDSHDPGHRHMDPSGPRIDHMDVVEYDITPIYECECGGVSFGIFEDGHMECLSCECQFTDIVAQIIYPYDIAAYIDPEYRAKLI